MRHEIDQNHFGWSALEIDGANWTQSQMNIDVCALALAHSLDRTFIAKNHKMIPNLVSVCVDFSDVLIEIFLYVTVDFIAVCRLTEWKKTTNIETAWNQHTPHRHIIPILYNNNNINWAANFFKETRNPKTKKRTEIWVRKPLSIEMQAHWKLTEKKDRKPYLSCFFQAGFCTLIFRTQFWLRSSFK